MLVAGAAAASQIAVNHTVFPLMALACDNLLPRIPLSM